MYVHNTYAVHVHAQAASGARIDDARDLGLFVRSERARRGLTQTQLCAAARVSRRWLSDLEAGKPTAEFGLVLRVVQALGQMLLATPALLGPEGVDLDDLLEDYEHADGPAEAGHG